MKLPDVNLLVAMSRPGPDHAKALGWREHNPRFATCALTELGLVRVLISLGIEPVLAEGQLENIVNKYRGSFVPCDLSATTIKGRVRGHKQVTDAYLVALARAHGLTLATFDSGIEGAEVL